MKVLNVYTASLLLAGLALNANAVTSPVSMNLLAKAPAAEAAKSLTKNSELERSRIEGKIVAINKRTKTAVVRSKSLDKPIEVELSESVKVSGLRSTPSSLERGDEVVLTFTDM